MAEDTHVNGSTVQEFSVLDPLNEKNQQKEEEKKRSLSERCVHVLSNVTVEPTMLLFVMSCVVTMLTTQNLKLEKACRVNLNFTDEICDSLKLQSVEGQNKYERETQKWIASAMAWRTYITATVPCVLALFIGSWSDMTGHRKIFIMIPIVGQILVCINNMIHTYFLYELRLEYLVFSDAILEGFTGGWAICFLAMFSYISSITSEKTRTFRLGLLNFSLTVGFPIGMGISGVLLKKWGYYGCYGLGASLHTVNLMYNAFLLKEPKRSVEQKKHDRQGVCYFFRTFFDLSNVKETMRMVFKDGHNNRRRRMCIMLAVVCLLFGPMYGEISIMYISTRYRFNWDEVKFSLFQTYNFVTHTVGTIFSITVFSKYLQWHDSMLGIISTVSKIAGSFIYCFAPNEKIFFFAPLVEIMNGTSLLAMRSIFSKMVAADELGKVNSILSLVENMMPLLYVPLYTKVYTATMEVLPGTVFLMGAMMTLPAVVVFFWLFYEHRKEARKIRKQVTES